MVESSFHESSSVGVSGTPDVVDVAFPDWADWGLTDVIAGLGVEEVALVMRGGGFDYIKIQIVNQTILG